MKRFFFACLATAGVFSDNTAFADHTSGYSTGYSSGYSYHEQLRHNSYDRALVHQESHRHPMASTQHHGLHDQLNHELSHDALRHRAYDRLFESPYGANSSTYRYRSTVPNAGFQAWRSRNIPNYGGFSFEW